MGLIYFHTIVHVCQTDLVKGDLVEFLCEEDWTWRGPHRVARTCRSYCVVQLPGWIILQDEVRGNQYFAMLRVICYSLCFYCSSCFWKMFSIVYTEFASILDRIFRQFLIIVTRKIYSSCLLPDFLKTWFGAVVILCTGLSPSKSPKSELLPVEDDQYPYPQPVSSTAPEPSLARDELRWRNRKGNWCR